MSGRGFWGPAPKPPGFFAGANNGKFSSAAVASGGGDSGFGIWRVALFGWCSDWVIIRSVDHGVIKRRGIVWWLSVIGLRAVLRLPPGRALSFVRMPQV